MKVLPKYIVIILFIHTAKYKVSYKVHLFEMNYYYVALLTDLFFNGGLFARFSQSPLEQKTMRGSLVPKRQS